MKPMNAPIAERIASAPPRPAKISSKTRAPRNEATIIENGGKIGTNIPTKRPITAPQLAARLPPVILVKYPGIKKSSTVTTTIAAKVHHTNAPLKSPTSITYRIWIASQLNGGPGSPGTILPTIPISPSAIASIINKVFILSQQPSF